MLHLAEADMDHIRYGLNSSCAGLSRVSTSSFRASEDVDGRAKPGQDEKRRLILPFCGRNNYPRTALRLRANADFAAG
jgi:hypothetical protein